MKCTDGRVKETEEGASEKRTLGSARGHPGNVLAANNRFFYSIPQSALGFYPIF